MSIRFVDDTDEGGDADAVLVENLGLVLFSKTGEWHAARHHDNVHVAGPGSLKAIPRGFWISNGLYEDSHDRQEEIKPSLLRSDGWMRVPTAEIRNAWGVSQREDRIAARVIAGSCSRAFRLVQEALHAGKMIRSGNAQSAIRKIQRASSLAMGLNALRIKQLQPLVPAESRMRDHFIKTWQSGMYAGKRKTGELDGTIRLSFSFPAFSYIRALTSRQVPAPGKWQKAARADEASGETFFHDLRRMERPAIIRGHWDIVKTDISDCFLSFANRARADTSYRSRWIDDEVPIIADHANLSIEGALVGEKWQDSPTGHLVALLEQCAGGPIAASLSWSAGLAAQNVMASGLRLPGRENQCPTSEAVWIAARDRVVMFPAIMRLCQSGASLVSAQSGLITLEVPDDPEILMIVAQDAWELGMHMTIHQVELLEDRGVPVPKEPSLYGGSEADMIMALAIHGKHRNALWRMDGILDIPEKDRSQTIMDLIRRERVEKI